MCSRDKQGLAAHRHLAGISFCKIRYFREYHERYRDGQRYRTTDRQLPDIKPERRDPEVTVVSQIPPPAPAKGAGGGTSPGHSLSSPLPLSAKTSLAANSPFRAAGKPA